MVDDHHATPERVPLALEAVWERLRAGEKLSAVRGETLLFSFRLRPRARTTPATVLVLTGSRWLGVGQLPDDANRLTPMPTKFMQAPIDAIERRAVCRLFDNDLLQKRLPSAYILVSRDSFDEANEHAYQVKQPDLYGYVIERKLITFLNPIRSVGTLSEAQEATLRKWIARDARKRVAQPAAPKPEDNEAKRRHDEQMRVLREIARQEDEDDARRGQIDGEDF